MPGGLNSRTRAVFFDLVGTLIHGRRPIGDQYASIAAEFGVAADARVLDQAFGQAMRLAPPMEFPGRSLDEAAELERAWWRDLVRTVVRSAGLDGQFGDGRFDAYFRRLFDHFTTAAAWETYPDALPALGRLHARGVQVGLITNYDTRVYPVLDAVGLSPYIDSTTIPAMVGAAKPSPAIFRYALRTHAIAPEDAVYVGDSFQDDYHGAMGAGMRAVLLDRRGRYLSEREVPRIETLEELLQDDAGD